jgi:shikimate kinase
MIVLMGIKHSGKTSLGKLLAKTLNLPFLDLDNLLEEEYSNDRILDFRQLYTKFGESGFKNLETSAIKKIHMNKKGILALGGGTIDNFEAMKIAEKADDLIFLDADEQILYKRIKNNGLPPFLGESPEKHFHELFTRRRLLYKNIATITLKITDEKTEELQSIVIREIGENL